MRIRHTARSIIGRVATSLRARERPLAVPLPHRSSAEVDLDLDPGDRSPFATAARTFHLTRGLRAASTAPDALDRRLRLAVLDLLREDAELDDDRFTPGASIATAVRLAGDAHDDGTSRDGAFGGVS
jgi:hypothetical protein